MANFLTQGELKSHIYDEVANEITRNDDSIIIEAIERKYPPILSQRDFCFLP